MVRFPHPGKLPEGMDALRCRVRQQHASWPHRLANSGSTPAALSGQSDAGAVYCRSSPYHCVDPIQFLWPQNDLVPADAGTVMGDFGQAKEKSSNTEGNLPPQIAGWSRRCGGTAYITV